MKNTITLKEAIERAKYNDLIVDGKVYQFADVEFAEAEMDTELAVDEVRNSDSWDKENYGKISYVVYGIVDGHRITFSITHFDYYYAMPSFLARYEYIA